MTATPNLDIEHLQPNAAQPDVVVDSALDALDAKITGTVEVVVGHTNLAVLTQDQQAAGSIFDLMPGGSPGPTADCTVQFAPFGIGVFVAINNTGFPCTLEYNGQVLSAPVLDAGSVGVFSGDGANIRAAGSIGSGGGIISAIEASENISAGAIVNVWNSGGARIRNANATDGTKPAHGFVMVAVLTGNIGVLYGTGQINNKLSALTPGTTYFLDTTNGDINSVAPSASGNFVQQVGFALSTTQMAFAPQQGILLP